MNLLQIACLSRPNFVVNFQGELHGQKLKNLKESSGKDRNDTKLYHGVELW
jgi:hypothetical protein